MKRLIGVGLLCSIFATPALAAPPGTPLEPQLAIAAQPNAIKISVQKNGWQRVRYTDLRKIGFKVSSTTPAKLRLYVDGTQVPIQLRRGVFEFYGEALDNENTDTRVYWLVSAGKDKPVSVATVRAGVRAAIPRGSFQATRTLQLRDSYYSPLLNGEESNLLGEAIRPGEVLPIKIAAPRAEPAGSATLRVAIQGYSLVSHIVKVSVNGTSVGTIAFKGQIAATGTFQLPAGMVKDGDNTVSLTAAGGEVDFSLGKSVELTYAHRFLAEADALSFTVRPGSTASVGGFTSRKVRLFDIGKSGAVARELVPTISGTAGNYVATVKVPAGATRVLALTDAKVAVPALSRNGASSLNSGAQTADFLIVSHATFIPALGPLVDLRTRQGLKVVVADVEDVYDEFSFGAHDPKALKTFFAWTKAHWQRAPRYILLVGDASNDPRGFTKQGTFDFVPTTYQDTQYMEAPSDDSLADLNADGIPEMAVGRLPVRTLEQATVAVAKIVGYEGGPARPRSLLLVADKNIDYDFEAESRTLYGLIPASTSVSTVYRNQGPTDAAVRTRLLGALNQGPTIVNFFGHGAVQIWTSGSILKASDGPNLTNRNSLSLYLMMTCLNGYFVDPKYESLGESLVLAPNGGAIATWSSSGLTVPTDQVRADQEAVRLLMNDPTMTLGDAMLRGKQVIRDIDVRHTWTLFGDPATRLH